ncbi:hypothetical protein ARMSODRAFT_1025364 [Armillaria solidipes]|uniref:Uncharacterized protein n=1 Tax=Armillaria solidipes TaxID=1076256 RepID=A0A2H3BDB5_9AGAR|nr:hypothetical protein ARMSODRAFT_1025364 [Armillaria solidipes]
MTGGKGDANNTVNDHEASPAGYNFTEWANSLIRSFVQGIAMGETGSCVDCGAPERLEAEIAGDIGSEINGGHPYSCGHAGWERAVPGHFLVAAPLFLSPLLLCEFFQCDIVQLDKYVSKASVNRHYACRDLL